MSKTKKNTKDSNTSTKKENCGYGLQIAIGIVGIIAILLLVLTLLPSTGSLAGTLTGTDFNGDGSAIRIRADIKNDTNKVAFGVSYEFIITDTEGNVVGTFTSHKIPMMLPGATKSVEEYIYFDNIKIDTGDVEIKVDGMIIGD